LAAIIPNRDKYMYVKNGRKLILYASIEYHFILKKNRKRHCEDRTTQLGHRE
jgi:hypothetical protein